MACSFFDDLVYCFDNSANQFVDCGNGTMTDNITGLTWMANPDCLVQAQTWADARLAAASLEDRDCGFRLPDTVETDSKIQQDLG